MTATTETPAYPCTCRPGCPETMASPGGHGQGWAPACYRRWERAGKPDGGPPAPGSSPGPKAVSTKAEMARRMETFTALRAQGLAVAAIAAEMGVTLRAAEHYAAVYRQQQRDGAMDTQIGWPRPAAPLPGVSHWSGSAACRGHQDLFYDPPGLETWRAREIREAKAKSLCASCPVLRQCRDYAAASGQRHGVWAGSSEGDRERDRKLRRNAARRGTDGERRRAMARREQGAGNPERCLAEAS